MTDEQWLEFKRQALTHNNIYIADAQRPLYDALVRPQDATQEAIMDATAPSPVAPAEPENEPPVDSEVKDAAILDIMLGRAK